MLPRMIVVAGPPGSGKSSAFPVSAFGVAAELNGGSYHGISSKIRQTVNREFETFIHTQIARRAMAAGYVIEMRYLALRDFALHLERIDARAGTPRLRLRFGRSTTRVYRLTSGA